MAKSPVVRQRLGILQTTINQINRKLALDKTYDIDVVRMVVLKYAYYLRNKLLHTERIPTYFLFDTANEEGVSFMLDPLVAICTDLIGSISSQQSQQTLLPKNRWGNLGG